ncbi:MAG: hypothetical protein WCI29_12540 [Actinomycetes bacterium]|jgi:plasmid maintenance system antidote protein VapI
MRAVTADTDLRLCRLFGLSDGYWLPQATYDIAVAQRALAPELKKIKPWAGTAAWSEGVRWGCKRASPRGCTRMSA